VAKRFPLEILISASDKATAVLNRISDRIDRFYSPFTRLRKALGEVTDKVVLSRVGGALKNVGTEALALGRRVAAGLAVATAAAGAFIRSQASIGDQINKASQRLNIGRAALQEYTYAFRMNGLEQAQVVSGLDTLNKNLGEAKIGIGKALPIFRGLAINPKQFATTAELLPVLADRLSRVRDPIQRAAIAGKLFGDSGKQMAVLLGHGSEELARWTKEARLAGAVIGDEALDGVAKFNDALDQLRFTLQGIIGNALGRIYPTLVRIAESIRATVIRYQSQIEQFARKFADNLPRYISNTVDALRGLRDVLAPISNLIGWMIEKFGAGNTVMIAFATIVGGKLIGALFSLGTALAALGVSLTAAFAAPALIIAGVSAIVAAGWWLYKNWDRITKKIGELFDWLFGEVWRERWQRMKQIAATVLNWIAAIIKHGPVGLIFRSGVALGNRLGIGQAPATATGNGTQSLGPTLARSGPGNQQEVTVKVDLSNLPPGTRTEARVSPGLNLALSRGWAMPGVGAF
jgi:phage-related minor tail protein